MLNGCSVENEIVAKVQVVDGVEERESVVGLQDSIKLLIDTDPGVDDVMALLLALSSPKVDLKAITLTHGNTSLSNVTKNLCSLFHTLSLQDEYKKTKDANYKDLYRYNSKPRVAIGSAGPIEGEGFLAEDVHGNDGLGNLTTTHPHLIDLKSEERFSRKVEEIMVDHDRFEVSELDAVDEMLFQIRSCPPFTLTIVTLGPLTTVAKAWLKDPLTFSLVKKVVVMGGAISVTGNVSPTAEFNFYADAKAAHIVMEATKGYSPQTQKLRQTIRNLKEPLPLHVQLVPLDITMQSYLYRDFLHSQLIDENSPLESFFKNMLEACISFSQKYELVLGVALHDPLAVGIAIGLVEPQTKFENVQIEYQSSHLTKAMCVVDRRFVPFQERTPINQVEDAEK